MGEERRTQGATSRPLDHGSPSYLRGCHLLHWPRPTRIGLTVGKLYVEKEGQSSRELNLDQRADNLHGKKYVLLNQRPSEKEEKTSPSPHPLVCPQRRYNDNSSTFQLFC